MSRSCHRPRQSYHTTNSITCGLVKCRARYVNRTFSLSTLLIFAQVEGLLLWGWLGGYKYDGGEIKAGRLLTIEELGEILKSMQALIYYEAEC